MDLIEGHMAIEPPAGVPVWDVAPYDPEILGNPDDYYAELRAKGPFAYIPKYSILACGRHLETREVFSDWERFSSSHGVGLQDFKLKEPWRTPSIVLEVDPPDHAQPRKVLARALSPKAAAALKEPFERAAGELIDELVAKGSFEAIEELAEVFPTRVFPPAVGMRQTDRRRLVDYGSMVFNSVGPDNKLRRDAMAMGPDIVPWIMAQCKRENLEPEGFGATIFAEDEAELLVRSLLSAGVDTTVTGLGSALWCLATNPDQYDRLKNDPKLLRPAFEEVLRFTSPVHSFYRTAGVDTEVSGVKIVKGTKILCVLGAANRDEDQWPDAGKFDVGRRPMGHLGMGTGIHGCVGQNLARAEVSAVLGAIVARVDRIALNGAAIWRPNNGIHALDTLPLTFIAQ